MAGGMFAGHDQCEGDVIEKNGKKFKLFYGMSSRTAMDKHAGKGKFKSFHHYFKLFCSNDSYYVKFLDYI